MTRTFSTFTFAALLAVSIAGQVQAQPGYPYLSAQNQSHVEWHYSPKGGAPYGVWVPNDFAKQKVNPAPKAAHVKKAKKANVADRSYQSQKLTS